MTPPGEPLQFKFGTRALKNLGAYEPQFPGLKEQIMAGIAEATPGALTVIWRKKVRVGDALKGMKVSLEAVSRDGRHGYFEVFYVERGDARVPVRITQGSFNAAAAAEFCSDYDGILEKRGA